MCPLQSILCEMAMQYAWLRYLRLLFPMNAYMTLGAKELLDITSVNLG